jgi:hypothetical protein
MTHGSQESSRFEAALEKVEGFTLSKMANRTSDIHFRRILS